MLRKTNRSSQEGWTTLKTGLLQVVVTTADGKPAAGETVTIKVAKDSIGQATDYTKSYTTNARGLAYVTIPAFVGHSMNISVSVVSTNIKICILFTQSL